MQSGVNLTPFCFQGKKKHGQINVFLVGGFSPTPFEKYESNWKSSPIFGVKIPNIFKTTTQPVYSLTSLINSDQSRRSSQLREEAGKLGLEFYCLDFSKQISRELLHEPVTILFFEKNPVFFVVPGFKKTSPSKKKY